MIDERNHAFRLFAGLLLASLAGCTAHSYSIETRAQTVVTASLTCIERAISVRYVAIEARTDTLPNGEERHVFFDLAKGEFNLDPEMRGYRLDWHRIDAAKFSVTLGWSKRGGVITALEIQRVVQSLEQIHASLSHDCELPKTKLELVDS